MAELDRQTHPALAHDVSGIRCQRDAPNDLGRLPPSTLPESGVPPVFGEFKDLTIAGGSWF
jgi:hypothetical protein